MNKPKPKKERYQNKVLCQGARNRFTAKQKVELIQQYDKAKAAVSSLTVKAWCGENSSLNYKGFLNCFNPMARKEIEIDAKDHRVKNSRCKDRSPHPSLLEDNSRGDQLYSTVTMWPMWPIKYNTSTQTVIFLRHFIEYQTKTFPWRKSFLSSKKGDAGF